MRDQVTRMTLTGLDARIRRKMISVDLIFRVPVYVCVCVCAYAYRVFAYSRICGTCERLRASCLCGCAYACMCTCARKELDETVVGIRSSHETIGPYDQDL